MVLVICVFIQGKTDFTDSRPVFLYRLFILTLGRFFIGIWI